MQIPLLSGIKGELERSYPLNLEPVIVDTKISKGRLKSTAGTTAFGTGPGVDRGGIEWQSQLYRVMGTKLVLVGSGGAVTVLGDVGGTGPCGFDIGFDRVAINSGTSLYYWDGVSLTQVTDIDLGPVIDMMWIDGYYMTTDGTSIVVTELADPTSVMPLKYGSAEEDPDMVTGLIKFRNEAYAIGRNTIQVFQNVGGNGFPFATLQGATIPFGCVSASAKCLYSESFAFVGSARNEALGVYGAGQGTAAKISTREVDDALAREQDPTAIILENRAYLGEDRLLVHLANETWCYAAEASKAAGEYVWFRLGTNGPYRPRNAVLCYGKWIVGDLSSEALGLLDDSVSEHFGIEPAWGFDCGLLYNQARGAIIHAVELIGLAGRGGTAFLSMTRDGLTYSVERSISLGLLGQRNKRMQWRPGSKFSNWLGLRFRGYGKVSFAACEAEIEGLSA